MLDPAAIPEAQNYRRPHMSEYPRLTKALRWLTYSVLLGAALGLYGRWQYHRGFDTGADTAICAFAIGIEGPGAVRTSEACRNIRDRNYVIDGFDPKGKSGTSA
jgi:hypothetical protein